MAERRTQHAPLLLPFASASLIVAASLLGYLFWAPSPRTADEARASAPSKATAAVAAADPGAKVPETAQTPETRSAELPRSLNRPPTENQKDYVAWMLAHTAEKEEELVKKWERARIIAERKDITSAPVLEAFLYTPRQFFARRYNLKKAYDDTAIPIGHGQTISGPNMVSAMTNAVNLRPGDRVLEVGTGSGYQAAVLSELSDHVYTIEIVAPLYAETDAIYKSLETRYPEYRNIARYRGDGYYGLPDKAPFQAIVVTAGIDHIPPPLLRQLAPGGIMVIPVGAAFGPDNTENS